MSEFRKWLENNKNHDALKANSYKNFYMHEKKVPYEGEVNTQLATYGDAVLKLALCDILWKRENLTDLTEEKKKYESDEVLVKFVAKSYNLLKYIQYDEKDKNIPQDYEYDSRHKYIATAVEACLGAIFLEDKNFDNICKIVKSWVKLIDSCYNGDNKTLEE